MPSPIEEHWPWYFKLFIRFTQRVYTRELLATDTWKHWYAHECDPPVEDMDRFFATIPKSEYQIRKSKLRKFEIMPLAEVRTLYAAYIANARALFQGNKSTLSQFTVIALRNPESGDNGINIHLGLANESGIARTMAARLSFRLMPDGRIAVRNLPGGLDGRAIAPLAD